MFLLALKSRNRRFVVLEQDEAEAPRVLGYLVLDDPHFLDFSELHKILLDVCPGDILVETYYKHFTRLFVKYFVSSLLLGDGLFQLNRLATNPVLLLADNVNLSGVHEAYESEPSELFGCLIFHHPTGT